MTGNQRLPGRARHVIGDQSNDAFVSAASAWEITTKHRIGKLPEVEEIAPDIASVIANQEFEELPITVDDAARAGYLPGLHGDPFDRMLIAQALARNLVLISNESMFDRYGVRRLW